MVKELYQVGGKEELMMMIWRTVKIKKKKQVHYCNVMYCIVLYCSMHIKNHLSTYYYDINNSNKDGKA